MRSIILATVAVALAPLATADIMYVTPPHLLYASPMTLGEPAEAAASDGWDGPGLGGATLTYYFGTMTSDLDEAVVKATLEKAMAIWAAVADITFIETSTPGLADSIDFYFATGDHGDGAPFDSGVLAHAYFPGSFALAGDVHFNDAFTWEVGDSSGSDGAYDLLWVAVHELGHSLGLGHSSITGSVMYPSVGSNTAFVALGADDIASIGSIYAPSTVPEPGSLPLAALAGAALLLRPRRPLCSPPRGSRT